MLKVAKFGGSSLAGANQFEKVKAIINADPTRRIVVVSAAGKRTAEDNKITDLLYLCHAHLTYGVSYEDIFSVIEQRFYEIRNQLGLTFDLESEFTQLRSQMNRDIPVDYLASRGEYFTARLMAEYLGYEFLDASDCIFFNYEGQFDMEKINTNFEEHFGDTTKLVIPGFYGSLPNGKIKVMSRGGSDITGAVLASAADADIYENWTDVSGIMMADPKIVDHPKPIQRITYSELRELAYMGASVLHEESIMPVKVKNIGLNIRNTNEPENPGTMILEHFEEENTSEKQRFITGIAGRKSFIVLTLYKEHIATEPSIIRKALEIFENNRVGIEHITTGIDSFTLVVSNALIGDRLYDILSDLKKHCSPDSIKTEENIALVAAVGRKMADHPGVAGQLFNALGQHNINIRSIAQGTNEISIVVGVNNSDYERAIVILYDSFVG